MFAVTIFFRYEHVSEDYRVQSQADVATWAEAQALITRARDWANVRNVGEGAMLSDVLVRIHKEGTQGWKYWEATATGSDYFGPMVETDAHSKY